MATNDQSLIEFTPFGTKDKIQLSIEIVKRLIAVKTKQGKMCSDDDAFRFMLMCQARKLNPFEGDAFLIGYDTQQGPQFSLITAHQAFLKRAELHPEFDGMDSGTIVQRDKALIDLVGDWHMPNDTILGGWATVFFKNRSHAMHKRLRLARFNKQYGIWRDDPAGMIVKCAEADALRSSFPTMLGGMFIREEMPEQVIDAVAQPMFQETTTTTGNGGPVSETVEQTAKAEPKPEPPKKKEPPTALRRKNVSRSTEPAKEPTPHERFASMIAVNHVTPAEFVTVATEQGWIEGITKFDEIPVDRVVEFMKPDNWEWIQSALDEYKAKSSAAATPTSPATPARTGELL